MNNNNNNNNNKEKIFVIISSIVNIFLLGFALFVLIFWGVIILGLLLTFFPLAVGLMTFLIVTKVKRFDLMRALKYFNLAYFASFVLPVGIILLLHFFPPVQPMYGVQVETDPVMQQCYEKCGEIANQTSEAFRNCVKDCKR
ncbi:MAG: hypothetical protein ACOCZQ_01155 [Nanoarchaeota archaeon]